MIKNSEWLKKYLFEGESFLGSVFFKLCSQSIFLNNNDKFLEVEGDQEIYHDRTSLCQIYAKLNHFRNLPLACF